MTQEEIIAEMEAVSVRMQAIQHFKGKLTSLEECKLVQADKNPTTGGALKISGILPDGTAPDPVTYDVDPNLLPTVFAQLQADQDAKYAVELAEYKALAAQLQ